MDLVDLGPMGFGVDVDEEDVARIGLASGGHFRCSGVPDAVGDFEGRVTVTERDELGAVLTQQALQMVGVDRRQRFPIRIEDAHGSVAGDDADVTGGHLGEVLRRLCNEIPLGMLGEPGGADDLDPGDDGEGIAAAQHVHVVGHS